MKVTEYIFVHNELNLLEAHLEEHSKFGWPMVICESTKNFIGNDKPLYFRENEARFARFNYQYLEVPVQEYTQYPTDRPYDGFRRSDWARRRFAFSQPVDTPWVYLNDVDEILNFEYFDLWKDILDSDVQYLQIWLSMFIGKVNVGCGRHSGYRMMRTGLTEEQLANPRLVPRASILNARRAGWHFTNCMSPQQLMEKAHTMPWYNDGNPSLELFEERLKDYRLDPLTGTVVASEDSVRDLGILPQWMQDNISLFPIAATSNE